MTGASEAVARVAQIQAMLAQSPVEAPVAMQTNGQSFASALQSAQSTSAASATTLPRRARIRPR